MNESSFYSESEFCNNNHNELCKIFDGLNIGNESKHNEALSDIDFPSLPGMYS